MQGGAQRGDPATAKVRILVVEDEGIVALDLRTRLQAMGYEVPCVATTGSQALEMATATEPHLILMDIRLEGSEDGIDTMKAIRRSLDVPAVYITAYADAQTLERAKATGTLGYLIKPFGDEELRAAIEFALYKHQAQRKLKETLSLLEATLEATADGILVMDTDGSIRRFNQHFADMWALPASAQTDPGASVLAWIVERVWDREGFGRRLQDVSARPEAESQDTLSLRDGRTVECSSRPQRLDARTVGRVWSFRDITVRRRAEEQVEYQALHDPLTGLGNRLLFSERLTAELARAERAGKRFALIFVDLDNFKLINDTLGHAAGDLALREIGHRLRRKVRRADAIARPGGDEFTILLTELTEAAAVQRISESILEAIARPIVLQGSDCYLTASVGVAVYPEDGRDAGELLKSADHAMYRAKELGCNNFQLATRHPSATALERLALENDLHRAVERREFVLHYQPIVELASGRMVGAEALLRWRHPKKGLLAPGEFIPLAERNGLIVAIGEWVLRTACQHAKSWRLEAHPRWRVAINVSPAQFLVHDLVQVVERALAEASVAPQVLELEITEGAAMHSSESTVHMLRSLRDRGIGITMDDFGSGYSSLTYVRRFPFTAVKIERAFVRDVHAEGPGRAIVQAMLAMAHALGLRVIAEGVETEQQLAFLREYQCDEGQGYLLGHPKTATELAEMLGSVPGQGKDV